MLTPRYSVVSKIKNEVMGRERCMSTPTCIDRCKFKTRVSMQQNIHLPRDMLSYRSSKMEGIISELNRFKYFEFS